jgi:hypothetical protein
MVFFQCFGDGTTDQAKADKAAGNRIHRQLLLKYAVLLNNIAR